MGTALIADGVRKRFGGLWAVDDVSLAAEPGAIVGLIGPNGSGKTTLINVLNGVHRPDGGDVRIGDTLITGRKPHVFAARGVARTFQTARVFSTITALENVMMPTLHHRERGTATERKAEDLLRFVELFDKRDYAASELSGGQQKLLEFARALITDPHVVLMDEPFAGVHPTIKELLRERILERNAQGTAFVIVSHEVPDLLSMSSHVICMDQGKVISEGDAETIQNDERVITAYLGTPTGTGGAR